jgi:hypothetical protein
MARCVRLNTSALRLLRAILSGCSTKPSSDSEPSEHCTQKTSKRSFRSFCAYLLVHKGMAPPPHHTRPVLHDRQA